LRAIARPRHSRTRAALAVAAGRATGVLSRRLRLGGGTSLPGLVALRIDPGLPAYLGAQLRQGSIVVTGTNGKTTTSGLVTEVLRAAGHRVWRNREGSNLMRGVATSLLIRARPDGKLRGGGDASAVFEVDEAAFPAVVAALQPRAIVITNLFRDQLDRYGEVDTVAEKWRLALSKLPPTTTLILNADDPAVAALADSDREAPVVYYGVEEAPIVTAGREPGDCAEVIDTRTCARCHAVLEFSQRFYSHIGHWSCPSCGYRRPDPLVRARGIHPDALAGTVFQLETPAGVTEARVELPGLYNVYNALAAAAVGVTVGAETPRIREAIARFRPAFGRAERIAVGDKTVQLLLAKNPTGLNEVLRALGMMEGRHHLLLALSDKAADGEDVSWIWDADYERVPGIAAYVTTTGTRAYDLALRLKYTGQPPQHIEPDFGRALTHALEHTPSGSTLYIVPTYTAMLAIRGELAHRGYTPQYWEQQDE
jgi:UDP-N-acetylmuramyl tripeptide synthase